MGPKMRMTQVSSIEDISPHMRRITLSGQSLSDFPIGKESAHVKVIFPNPESIDKQPKLGLYLGFKKWMRSYTIRQFDPLKMELTLDFAVHDHKGLATNWACQAKKGDYLGIAGPGALKHASLDTHKHLFFGDLTALPAIASILEKLAHDAIGSAYIQVPNKQDIQVLKAPTGISINWLVTTDKLTDDFLNGLKSESTELANTAIFMACEASIIKQLKSYLNKNCQYNKSTLYASAYWNQKIKAS